MTYWRNLSTLNRRLLVGLVAFLLAIIGSVAALSVWSQDHWFIKIHGQSMAPTFQDGDWVIFDRLSADETRVGDIATFKLPEDWKPIWKGNDENSLVKRIAARGGDTISWDGTTWYRNGESFSSITQGSCPIDPLEVKLEEGEYFLTGDTVEAKTLDSREAMCRGVDFLVRDQQITELGRVAKIIR